MTLQPGALALQSGSRRISGLDHEIDALDERLTFS